MNHPWSLRMSFGQCLVTLTMDPTSSLGQLAKETALSLMTPEALDAPYALPGNSEMTGWDLLLWSDDTDLLEKALPLIDEAKPIAKTLPPITQNSAPQTLAVWLKLKGEDRKGGLIRILSQGRLKGEACDQIVSLLSDLDLSIEELDRLCLWRIQSPISTKTAKAMDALVAQYMKDPVIARQLTERLIIERRLPHAISWLACVGKGAGFNTPLPHDNLKINALFNQALSALGSAHGRLKILGALTQFKSWDLRTGKDMNAALRIALETSQ